MMNRKISLLVAFAVMLALFTGCQLAKADVGPGEDDKLIGVFVTFEHLDLFDFEAFFDENTHLFTKGGDVHLENANGKYYHRIDAVKYIDGVAGEETEERQQDVEYRFEGIEGIGIYAPVSVWKGESYVSFYADEGMSDVQYTGGSITSLEGTIYVKPSVTESFYMNLVYQESSGEVYLTSGRGMSGNLSLGASMSQFFETTQSVMVNEELDIEEKFSVSIAYTSISPTEKVNVIVMDKENEIVSSEEFVPQESPESFKFPRNAEYVIVESHVWDENNEPVIEREIYSRGDESIAVFKEINDKVLYRHPIEVIWE